MRAGIIRLANHWLEECEQVQLSCCKLWIERHAYKTLPEDRWIFSDLPKWQPYCVEQFDGCKMAFNYPVIQATVDVLAFDTKIRFGIKFTEDDLKKLYRFIWGLLPDHWNE